MVRPNDAVAKTTVLVDRQDASPFRTVGSVRLVSHIRNNLCRGQEISQVLDRSLVATVRDRSSRPGHELANAASGRDDQGVRISEIQRWPI